MTADAKRIVATLEADTTGGRFSLAGAGRLTRALTSTPFLGAAVAFLTWPLLSIVPATGADPSWMAGLYMAFDDRLQFGKEIVFTYGPFGFLQAPVLYDERLWVISFLYRGFIYVALATSLLWVARRAFPLALALAACYALLVVGYLEGAVVPLAFVWCFVALGEEPPGFVTPLVVFGGGAIGAIELLGKANYGVAVLAFSAVAVLGMPNRRRNVPLFVVVAGGVFAMLWLLAGQDFGNLPIFAEHSLQEASGYSRSMVSGEVAHAWELPAALAGIGLLIGGAVLASRQARLPRRLASVALVAVFAYLTFKQGFVRQGLGNTPDFFAVLCGGAIAVAAQLPRHLGKLPRSCLAIAFVAPFVMLAAESLPTVSLWHSLNPEAHSAFLRQDLDALLSSGERAQLVTRGRREMRSSYRVDPSLLRALGNRPVHIDPDEVGVAWAYGLNWDPLPVMQSYAAYTPALDALNAEALAGNDGPAAILRQATGVSGAEAPVDGRYPSWDPPAASRAMLCNYRAALAAGDWQLLERAGDRCGAIQPIGITRSATGERIRIPVAPSRGELVFARVEGLGVTGLESLRADLYRVRQRTARVGRNVWDLAAETAGDGLILRVPRAVDYRGRFRLAPDARSVSFDVEGDISRPLTVRFFAQRVHLFSTAADSEPWLRR